MALLQISEPGMSAAPHQHRLAVGIDLGTTNSLVATVRSGSAVCLPDSDGRTTLPSVVRYLDGEVEVGKNALSAQKTDPLNTVMLCQTPDRPHPYRPRTRGAIPALSIYTQ